MSSKINVSKNKIHLISVEDIDKIDINSLLDAESILFYNKPAEKTYIDYRCMDDTSFANKVFKVAKVLRENGYDGHIIVDCDSLFDLGNSIIEKFVVRY